MCAKANEIMGRNVDSGSRHVSLWAVLYLFHVNVWNSATAQGDPSILSKNRDVYWQANFQSMATGHDNDPLKIDYQAALVMLGYCCNDTKCGPGGAPGMCRTCAGAAPKSTGGKKAETDPLATFTKNQAVVPPHRSYGGR